MVLRFEAQPSRSFSTSTWSLFGGELGLWSVRWATTRSSASTQQDLTRPPPPLLCFSTPSDSMPSPPLRLFVPSNSCGLASGRQITSGHNAHRRDSHARTGLPRVRRRLHRLHQGKREDSVLPGWLLPA